jgi:hypothetical protein
MRMSGVEEQAQANIVGISSCKSKATVGREMRAKPQGPSCLHLVCAQLDSALSRVGLTSSHARTIPNDFQCRPSPTHRYTKDARTTTCVTEPQTRQDISSLRAQRTRSLPPASGPLPSASRSGASAFDMISVRFGYEAYALMHHNNMISNPLVSYDYQ